MTKTISQADIRAALAANEAALRARLDQVTGSLTGRGADATRAARALGGQAASTARAYPVAATLLGAGLAYLAYATATTARRAAPEEPKADALARWEDEGGLPVEVGEIEEQAQGWLIKAREARNAALSQLSSLYDSGLATAEEKAKVTAGLAQDLAAAFRSDLTDLGEEAANRVAEARAQAYAALTRGREAAVAGAASGLDTVRAHPVASSAFGLAVGAIVALAFPKTRPLLRQAAPIAASALMAKAAQMLAAEREGSLAETVREAGKKADSFVEEVVKEMEEKADALASAATKKAEAVAKSARKSAQATTNGAAH